MKHAALSELPLEEIKRIAAIHGAHNLMVFGSRARGDHRPDSNLDFLVDFEPGRSLLDAVGLEQNLEDLLGMKVQAVTRRSLRPSVRDEVLAEAVALQL